MLTCRVTFSALPHFDEALGLPAYATPGAAGADLRLSLPEAERAAGLTLAPLERVAAPTGLAIAIPEGWEGQVRARSGLALRLGLGLPNAPGTIDSDYRGELKVLLVNLGAAPARLAHGDRIAQLVLAPVARASFGFGSLEETERGAGGFGSTGVSGAAGGAKC